LTNTFLIRETIHMTLDQLKKVHILGVCGTLMGSFAVFLKRRGIHVTGSDQNIYPPMSDVLKDAGVKVFQGFHSDNLNDSPDMVVIGNVIRKSNTEAQTVINRGMTYTSLPEFMEKLLLKNTTNLVVSGTHGKTTTATMLAHVLLAGGKDPSYFVGGVCSDLPHSFHVAESDKCLFVLEGDEYDTAFWDKVPKFNHYLPDQVILTSLEYDHADIYPDMDSIIDVFNGLLERIREGGNLIACVDYPEIETLIKTSHVPVITYGTTDKAQFWIDNLSTEKGVSCFDIMEGGKKIHSLQLQSSGFHNALNSLAVWLQCRALGLKEDQIAHHLLEFQGVKRRQEERGEINGVLVIDDFAHHPTAVRETLRGLKMKYDGRRLIAVFEPRSATSRRKIFQQEYVKSFESADAVFISMPHNQTGIPDEDKFSSEELVREIKKPSKVFLMPTPDEGVQDVKDFAKSGDVVAVLSNGGFFGFIPKLIEALN